MSPDGDDSQNADAVSRDMSTTQEEAALRRTHPKISIVRANDGRFPAVLLQHNINPDPDDHDDKFEELKKLVERPAEQQGVDSRDYDQIRDVRWERDMSKCKLSNEAIFQRTIMVDIIGRDGLGDKLDYTCEAPWKADRMPSCNESVQPAQPKPDLAVAFKTLSLLSSHAFRARIMRLGKLSSHICAEGLGQRRQKPRISFLLCRSQGQGRRNWKYGGRASESQYGFTGLAQYLYDHERSPAGGNLLRGSPFLLPCRHCLLF